MAESGVDALSEGLQRVIAPAVRECDAAAASCATAQADLTAHVDRLAHELEVLLAAMPAEASEGHAERVRRVRARVEALGTRMADVEGRMTRLHRAAAGLRRADIAKLLFRNGDDLDRRRRRRRRGASAAGGAVPRGCRGRRGGRARRRTRGEGGDVTLACVGICRTKDDDVAAERTRDVARQTERRVNSRV